MKEIREEQRQRTSSAQKTKDEPNRTSEHRPVPEKEKRQGEMTMANYDDIFNASAQKGTEDKSFVSFNKEEWAAQKKQERESAFAMIDETAQLHGK